MHIPLPQGRAERGGTVSEFIYLPMASCEVQERKHIPVNIVWTWHIRSRSAYTVSYYHWSVYILGRSTSVQSLEVKVWQDSCTFHYHKVEQNVAGTVSEFIYLPMASCEVQERKHIPVNIVWTWHIRSRSAYTVSYYHWSVYILGRSTSDSISWGEGLTRFMHIPLPQGRAERGGYSQWIYLPSNDKLWGSGEKAHSSE